ncbi:serine hydrolase [Streptomyces sp. P9(2023)]|uniref:D-alanyl-D-alanine carboxypeptidase family protein n=1 Tax=Streptomyces sp. P9(2023) TaxID=3064394 RepID=UPI0028F3F892|nr:serine hydrolase [Streptomyces sp. P9(2023)]MDT9691333.1 serine hydrolase [Streptomyces sp. P9(2023)]
MIVMSAVRHVAAGATALLLVLPVPAATASSVTEPTPPAERFVDPARLYRSGAQVQPLSGAPAAPDSVSALSWLVADASTGEVLGARNAHRRLPPASTLKTLFAVTALPRVEQEERHTVSESELTGIGSGSSMVGVKAGLTYKVSDLWNGVFLSSGNDAVRVLAAMNGGWESMARQMQEKARALGARDTRVVSPDGYDAPGQVSSAYDLAVFGRAGLQDPAFVRYCSTPYANFPAGGWSYGIRNTNRLLTGAGGVARYPGLIGVKNGYTSNAGNTLIAAARRGSRTLVVSVMNPQSGGGLAVYEEARTLLDWGFDAAGRVQPVGSLAPTPVLGRSKDRQLKKATGKPAAKPRESKAAESVPQAGPEARGDAGRSGDRPAGTERRTGAAAVSEDLAVLSAPRKSVSRDDVPSGPWAGLPLALVGASLGAALSLWLWRRRSTRRGDGGM